jgi:CxxC motif-containing protein (DUF1111 family)
MVPDENGNIHAGRFGQKANIVDVFEFTESAFFNELGITNKFNPTKHLPQGLPFAAKCNPDNNSPNDVNGNDLVPSYLFNEMLAPVAPTGSNAAGKTVFETTGCNLCHIESMTTGPNIKLVTDLNGDLTTVVTPLSNVVINLYSDLLLHDMGPGLSGGIPFQPEQEGQATLTQWRTAPLWGLHLRVALGLMHDNQASSLDTAIKDHGGEASQVVTNYLNLSPTDNANLLAFLNTL